MICFINEAGVLTWTVEFFGCSSASGRRVVCRWGIVVFETLRGGWCRVWDRHVQHVCVDRLVLVVLDVCFLFVLDVMGFAVVIMLCFVLLCFGFVV